jgi:signal transduction histidine kinase
MDEETQRLAFDRFHQAERSHSGKGSGLGLSIAKEVLQKMGVEITLKSALGEGSEFSFTIP